MNEEFIAGFFKEFDGSYARMKQFFTEQLNKNDDLKDSNEKLALKVKSFGEKITLLETEKKDLQRSVAEKTAECDGMAKSNKKLTSEVKLHCKERLSLLEKVSLVEKEKKALEKQLSEKTAECAEMAKANEKLNFNIVGFQVGNQAHGEKISNLEKETHRLSSELQSRNKAFEELQQKLVADTSQYKSEITELDSMKKMIESRLNEKTVECTELKNSNDNFSEEKVSDREKILKLESELETMKKQLVPLQNSEQQKSIDKAINQLVPDNNQNTKVAELSVSSRPTRTCNLKRKRKCLSEESNSESESDCDELDDYESDAEESSCPITNGDSVAFRKKIYYSNLKRKSTGDTYRE